MALLCGASAAVYGWAAVALPHRLGGVLQILAGALCAVHLVWLGAALAGAGWAVQRLRLLSRAALTGSLGMLAALAQATAVLLSEWGTLGAALSIPVAAIGLVIVQIGVLPEIVRRSLTSEAREG